MLLKNKQITIIGAGPVGLTLARLLQQKGVDVTVYERDKDAQTRIWGGTLDLHKGSGQDALEKAGLLEKYYSAAIPMGRRVADEQGKIVFTKKLKPEELLNNPEINRNDLRTLLLDSLSENTIAWDHKLTGLEINNGKWLLHFENKPDATADLVIAANGGMSKVRDYITDAKIEYSGTSIIMGEVLQAEIKCPEFYKLCDNNILMASSKGNLLVANPKNNNALTYGITFKTPEAWNRLNGLDFQNTASIVAYLLNRFSDWNESYLQLFRSTKQFAGFSTRKISLDMPWRNNRPLPITLIGDAAHIMPPFAGQGVNIGMVDASILSENLTNEKFESIETAIADYEKQMFAYAKKAQLETSVNEAAMHHPDFSFQKRFAG